MSKKNYLAKLHTRSTTQTLHIQLADHFFSRLKGLMFKRSLAQDTGLLLTHCSSVHTAFMRFSIDVIYLDCDGKVLKCVSRLKPWRGSISQVGLMKRQYGRAVHTLELTAGSIERFGIRVGDYLEHPIFPPTSVCKKDSLLPLEKKYKYIAHQSQRGSALIEFVVIGPVVTLIGLAILQYGMLFFAKNQMNHATFMAARAGSVNNADLSAINTAYARALIPIYGGGENEQELIESLAKASADVAANTRIELLNPTQESFKDWNDPELQALLKTGNKRVIPNALQGFKNQDIGSNSGQTIQDANMIKLRITHGYEPKIPLVANIYTSYLQWLDTKTDAFHTRMVSEGRIPVVMHVTLQMQSDAIEGNPISVPGKGNDGSPTNPGDPAVVNTDPPDCKSISDCPKDITPGDNSGGSNNNGGGSCPVSNFTTIESDTLFAFGKSSIADLLPGGIAKLNELIKYAKEHKPTSAEVTGYTDQLGSNDINLPLSLARAETVKKYLKEHGFPDIPITTVGAGSANPIKQLSDCPRSGQAQKDCLAPNRRVTVKLNP